jgi:hypothetical protein
MAKAKQTVVAAPQKDVAFKITFAISNETPVYYINHAEISHTPHEFGILVGRIPTRLPAAQLEEVKQSGTLSIEPELQLLFPTKMIIGLAKALQIQQEKYEQKFGKIAEIKGVSTNGNKKPE